MRWGFDGHGAGPGFIPLAVLVDNPAARPFDAVVTLSDGGPLMRRGVAWTQACYLTPGGSRWLLFAPWVDQSQGFRLDWSEGGADLPDPVPGSTAASIALAPDDGPGHGARALPAPLFPANPALWNALGRLALDRDPRWTPAQRQACAAWVRSGGELHLAADRAGRLPGLPADLAGLARDAGAGRLLAHPGVEAAAVLAALPEAPPGGQGDERRDDQLVEEVQRLLADPLQARPNWALIILVLVLFLVAAGPLAWALGRRRPWWAVQAAVIAATVAATLAVAWVGRRGQGEAALTRLGVSACDDGAGTWTAEWLAATFVTATSRLELRPPVAGRAAIACPGTWEALAGAVDDAGPGRLITEVPLFSVRQWAAAGACRPPLPTPLATVRRLAEGHAASVELPPTWPDQASLWLAGDGQVAPLSPAGGRHWTIAPAAQRVRIRAIAAPPALEERMPGLARRLAERSLAERPPAADRVVLLMALELPTALQAEGAPGRQEGLLLYRRDIAPEAP